MSYSSPPSIAPGSLSPLIGADSIWSVGPTVRALNITWNSGTAWPTANTAFYVPLVVPYPVTVVKLWGLVGGTSSGNVDVGLYDANGSRVISSGSTAMGTASTLQEFDVTDTLLVRGRYFIATAVDNTTAAWTMAAPGSVGVTDALGVLQQASAFALPATATFAGNTNTFVPQSGIAVRTLVT